MWTEAFDIVVLVYEVAYTNKLYDVNGKMIANGECGRM
jgi:hypothetical protein